MSSGEGGLHISHVIRFVRCTYISCYQVGEAYIIIVHVIRWRGLHLSHVIRCGRPTYISCYQVLRSTYISCYQVKETYIYLMLSVGEAYKSHVIMCGGLPIFDVIR